jgi:hypothetical protein
MQLPILSLLVSLAGVEGLLVIDRTHRCSHGLDHRANKLDFIGKRCEFPQLSPTLVLLRARSFEDGSHLRRSQT